MSAMDRKTLHRVLADPFTRRQFLGGAGMLAGLVIAREMPALAQDAPLSSDPFTLGVASGDPLPDSVVIWTRLAPDPLNGGLKTDKPISVRWEVATDEKMAAVVQKGETVAVPQFAHSVHVELTGLQPNRPYWYRFYAGTYASPIGRTRTAPSAGMPLSRRVRVLQRLAERTFRGLQASGGGRPRLYPPPRRLHLRVRPQASCF
jgi:alkaline phosphatase D